MQIPSILPLLERLAPGWALSFVGICAALAASAKLLDMTTSNGISIVSKIDAMVLLFKKTFRGSVSKNAIWQTA